MMVKIALAGLILLFSAAAYAADLPRFDVPGHCRTIANVGGTYSASIENVCISQEQVAYDSLKAGWGSIADKTQLHCTKIAQVGSPSYTILKVCIEQEIEAAGNTPVFKF